MSQAQLCDIVLVDIIGFSRLDIGAQHEIITYVSKSYRRILLAMLRHADISLEQLLTGIIPTGDGFFCILHPDYQGFGPILALSFSHLSELITEKYPYFKGIRIAVHTGEVQKFKDIMEHENFVGYGLNVCERYISSQKHTISTVLISTEAYSALETFLQAHPDFYALLLEREFKFSAPYLFDDKHKNAYVGYLIWMRKGGIITPPRIHPPTKRTRRPHAL
ncbi:MAG: hypothetical protein JXK05_06645 [Campylobacterales bacterium]|nr:hypothetical protein [Campylobacterales bacterium]